MTNEIICFILGASFGAFFGIFGLVLVTRPPHPKMKDRKED